MKIKLLTQRQKAQHRECTTRHTFRNNLLPNKLASTCCEQSASP